jgi:hypothetical protein
MILLINLDFNSLFSQVIDRPSKAIDENKPVNCTGRLYSFIYKFLEVATKHHIGRIERSLKAIELVNSDDFELAQAPDGEYYVSSQSDEKKMYQVSYFSCSCPDHQYRGSECKHIQAFRLANPIKSITPSVMPRLNVFANLSTISDADLARQAELARADCGF